MTPLVLGYLAVGTVTLSYAWQGALPERRTWEHNLGRTVVCLTVWPVVWWHVWRKLR